MVLTLIGGQFRNRPLKSPKGTATRPTSALLRKSVFDICSPFIADARFLDLYAGSGAMGLEALSRGAQHATFVDTDRYALQCIRENIQLFHLESSTRVVKEDALLALKRLQKEGEQFDIIYIDPPYNLASYLPLILEFLDASTLLSAEAIVFFEEGAPPLSTLTQTPTTQLFLKDSRKFGKSLLHQYRKIC